MKMVFSYANLKECDVDLILASAEHSTLHFIVQCNCVNVKLKQMIPKKDINVTLFSLLLSRFHAIYTCHLIIFALQILGERRCIPSK